MPAPNTASSSTVDQPATSATNPAWFEYALTQPGASSTTVVDGCEIHFLSWGDSAQPGLLLTHGMMAHARCWAFIAPLLADHFHVVSYDISGMGDSGWRSEYDFDIRADEALAVAEAAGMLSNGRKPILVCHSFGGSIGIAATLRHPDAWAGLILCDMAMVRPGDEDRFAARRQQATQRQPRTSHRIYPDLPTALGRFRLAPDQPCANDFLFDFIARHSLKQQDGGWTWKFDPAILSQRPGADSDDDGDPQWWQNLAERFATLNLPRAIIYGRKSELFSAQLADYVAELVAKAGLPPIPMVGLTDAYHHVMLDQPIALSATIDGLAQAMVSRPD